MAAAMVAADPPVAIHPREPGAGTVAAVLAKAASDWLHLAWPRLEIQEAHSKGVHLMMRAGRKQKPIPLPSVQQVKPYLAVLSTLSTAGIPKCLPSCTLYHVHLVSGHAGNLHKMYLKLVNEAF